MPHICIFCGERGGSDEHLFPTWLNDVFAELPPRTDEGNVEWSRTGSSPITGEVFAHSWSRTEIASVTSRSFCRDCNNGWMSQLEERAKPLLKPMILGHPTGLTHAEQLIVATWATKSAMALETTFRNDRMFDVGECATVRLLDRPPAHVLVVTAMLEGTIPPLRYTLKRLGYPAPGSEWQLHTLQLHTLVLQVIRPVPVPAEFRPFDEVKTPRQDEITLYPPVEEFYWPPAVSLDPSNFERYTTRGLSRPDEAEPGT